MVPNFAKPSALPHSQPKNDDGPALNPRWMIHCPVSLKSLYQAFMHQACSRPDATALLLASPNKVQGMCSWRSLASVVHSTAHRLQRQLDKDRSLPRCIGYASDNSDADIVIAIASMALGTTEAPLDGRLGAVDIARRWSRMGGLWIDETSKGQIHAELAASCHATTLAEPTPLVPVATETGNPADQASLILWTSGTTRQPEGVLLSQHSLFANAAAKLKAVPQNQSDVRLTVLPLSHAYARTCDFGTWLLSGCTLALSLGYRNMLERLSDLKPHLINTVPALANRLLEDKPAGLEHLRLLGCGGAPLRESTFAAWKQRGVTVIQGYGLTETGPVICSATANDATPGLVGAPVEGWETRIEDGQLFVRGPHTMLGYLDHPQATQERMTEDGWLATGDVVQQDATTNQLRVLGRVDDVIVLESGTKIFPAVIEREIEGVDGIAHALLYLGDSLQLWLDLNGGEKIEAVQTAVFNTLSCQNIPLKCSLHHFDPKLSFAAGELTAKGTMRRGRIIHQRLANHAGS